MSQKKQIIELSPPEYEDNLEKIQLFGLGCPKCNSRGWLKDWDAQRDDKNIYDCPRCGGSGKLKAEVAIVWSAEEISK